LPYDIDGVCVYELPYDKASMMTSIKDGRPWMQWNTSKRQGFNGVRRVASCEGTYVCKNERCPYFHSYNKQNKMQFKRLAKDNTVCGCCGYDADQVSCDAKKIWEFHSETVMIYHCGKHSCSAKRVQSVAITEVATKFFHGNTAAKPSQFPYEHLRGLTKKEKSVEDIYAKAKGMANLKKIQILNKK